MSVEGFEEVKHKQWYEFSQATGSSDCFGLCPLDCVLGGFILPRLSWAGRDSQALPATPHICL